MYTKLVLIYVFAIALCETAFAGFAAVSQGVTISPNPVTLGQNFTAGFTLKETSGTSSIALDSIAVAILKSDGSMLFNLTTYETVHDSDQADSGSKSNRECLQFSHQEGRCITKRSLLVIAGAMATVANATTISAKQLGFGSTPNCCTTTTEGIANAKTVA